jgi:hypothetical protein
MAQARTTSTASASGAQVRRGALRSRCGEESYIAGLKARLSIAPDQSQAWEAFADALYVNKHRMRNGNAGESPFGPIAHRLNDLASMQRAAQQLFGALGPVQRRAAVQVLPLCCLQDTPEIRRLEIEGGEATPGDANCVGRRARLTSVKEVPAAGR